MRKYKIYFLCTDNFTRSVTAEMCLKDYLLRNNISNIEVGSLGTNASSDTSSFHHTHFDYMKELGIDVSTFERIQLTNELFDTIDLIIGMAEEHQTYVYNKYKKIICIYSEFVSGKKDSIFIPKPDVEGVTLELKEMVDYIYSTIPSFFVKSQKKYIKKF